MFNKNFLGLIVLFVCAAILYRGGCTIIDLRPSETRLDSTLVDPMNNPVQENISAAINTSFIKEVDGVKALLTPKAHYKISGRVVSRRHYYMDWFSKLSPVDLAMAWGDFSTKKYDDHLSYSHSDRYYSDRYDGKFEGDPRMIATHSANEHLIPANDLVSKTLKSVKEGEIVELSGELVDVEWVDEKGVAAKLDTSMDREDTGVGACEIVFVKKLKIKNKVYE